MEVSGSIVEKFRQRRKMALEWKIPDFFNLSSEVGRGYSSPSFEYCSATLHFVIYPNGRNAEGCDSGFFCAELWKSVSEVANRTPFLITLSIKKADTTEEVMVCDQEFPEEAVWRANKFLQSSELLRRRFQLVPWGDLTIVCTLCVDEAHCNDDATDVIEQSEGSIREEVCPSHKHVLWSFDYERLRDGGVTVSPSFSIDNQEYLLKLQRSMKDTELQLFRKGPSEARNVRWWAGLKRGDGKYHQLIKKGDLRLEEECELWTHVKKLESFITTYLEENHLARDGLITFFFRMNFEQASNGDKMCTHDVAEMKAPGDGRCEVEMCRLHTNLKWTVDCRPLRECGRNICSYAFDFGNQSYFVKLERHGENTEFTLFRMGPSVNSSIYGYIQWYAGLKRGDKDHYLTVNEAKFYLDDECEVWTAVENLASFSADDLERADTVLNERLTFFALLKMERAPTSPMRCEHRAIESSRPSGEVFVKDGHTWYLDIWWCVLEMEELLTTKTPFRYISPEFYTGSQSYKLEFSSLKTSRWINVFLHRRGPSVESSCRFVRWWAKLLRRDGTFERVKGELDLKEECVVWTQRNLCRIPRCVNYFADRWFRYPEHWSTRFDLEDERMFVEFRLLREPTCRESEKRISDAVELLANGDGTIWEEECPSHTHVEWYIDKWIHRKKWTSPAFYIGSRRYRLKIASQCDYMEDALPLNLHLISGEPFVADASQPIRWYAGVMFNGGVYHFDHVSGRLDLNEECNVWTQKLLHLQLIGPSAACGSDEKFTFFFRMDNETKHGTSMACKYDFVCPVMAFPICYGTAFVTRCSHHWQVEWSPRCNFPFWDMVNRQPMSCVIDIGGQRYALQLKSDGFMLIELVLCSMTTSARPSRSVRWWAGFKRSDGTYLSNCTSGILDLEDLCEMWTSRCLLSVNRIELDREMLTGGFPSVFFRMNFERPRTEKERCSHSDFEIPAEGSGTIPRVERLRNKRKEFVLHSPSRLSSDWWTVKSPEFAIGAQRFYFQLSRTLQPCFPMLSLQLYSRGPVVTGRNRTARWWAGLKRNDGTYYHRNLRGELSLKEPCQMWTLRASQQYAYCEFTREMLSPGGQLFTVFFQLSQEKPEGRSAEQASTAAAKYIPGIVEISSARSFGNIQKKDCASYTQVKWTALYDPLEGKNWSVVSPEFTIGTQLYILELIQDSNDPNFITLCLYRSGSSVTGPSGFVQWWAGLMRGNGTYHHRNQRGELDLKGACELWTQIYLLTVSRLKFERDLLTSDDHVTVFFRLTKEHVAVACTHDGDQAPRDFKRQRRDDDSDVVFKVKDAEFKVSRTVIEDQIPVFNAMFLHDTAEKRTGVVSMEDIEPAIFEEFLHYVSTGLVRELTVHNAYALYIFADKYLADDLKAQCLQHISDTLSVHGFCDFVTFALFYREDDLMEEAVSYLSWNEHITDTDSWENFDANNTELAKELQMRASLPM